MKELKVVADAVNRIGGNKLLTLQKHSPKIMAVAGTVCVGTGVVLFCKSTIKAQEIIKQKEDLLNQIHTVKKRVDDKDSDPLEDHKGEIIEYSDEDYKKDLLIAYSRMAGQLIKCYLPAATLTIAGVGLLLGAQGILSKRNAGLVAAYKAVEESYQQYRTRAVEELGAEKDEMFYKGVYEQVVEEEKKDKEGKTKKVKKTVKTVDPNHISPYAKFFDDASEYYENDTSRNMYFLTKVQNQLTDRLRAKGHLFLNEAYDELGIPRTSEGAIAGWIYDPNDTTKDNYVDFGLFNGEKQEVRDFVNGYQQAILIDPNVDGIIYDLI